ncbi:TIR domain-containing protein [Nonomuraea wenchangensis]|uniref:TIR domain-containing protein n=1 Tax=Nonomuraea wenchangensis TaxID=568860 RepID=UPI00384AF9C9
MGTVNRAFVSFDYDHDAALKHFLVGQSKNPDSPYEIHDWSIKEASPGWREEARRRIRASDVVIVICGEHTHTAKGVAIELEIAQSESIPYFLLWGYAEKVCTKPTTAKAADKVYKWTWENLKSLIGGAR